MTKWIPLTAFPALCALLALSMSGCIEYTDRVACSNGQVLNEDDECVPPPLPDGGIAIADCDELCAALEGWNTEQLTCVSMNLSAAGPPPTECMTDLSVRASCDACVVALMLDGAGCATAGAICQ